MEHGVPSENFQRENGTTFSKVPFFPEIFQWNKPKNHVPFTTQPEFPDGKRPQSLLLGRVRLGSIRNKNNWNNASKRLFGSCSHSGIPGFPFRLFYSQEQNSRNIFQNKFLFRNIPNERAHSNQINARALIDTRRVRKPLACGSWFTNSSRVLPTISLEPTETCGLLLK